MNKPAQKTAKQPFEKNILNGVIAIIALSPLYFGGNRPTPVALITLFTGLLLLCWGGHVSKNASLVKFSLRKLRFEFFITMLVFLWMAFCAMRLDIGAISNPWWQTAQQLLPDLAIKGAVSVTPHKSWLQVFKIISYSAIFWLALQLARNDKNATKMLRAIAYSGLVYGAYGIIIQSFKLDKILWYDKPDYWDSLTSTFINRNSYAAYAGVTMVVSAALFFNGLFKNTGNLKGKTFYKLIIQRFCSSSAVDLLIFVIICAALVMSGSRAGIACSVLGFSIFMLLSIFNYEIKNHRRIFIIFAVAIILFFVVIFITGGSLASLRMQSVAQDANLRSIIYTTTIRAISDKPLIGAGIGSFTDVFKNYKDLSASPLGGTITTHAHNSYLELALEIGVFAAFLIIAVMAIFLTKCFKGSILRKKNGHLCAAAASGVVIIASHCLFDFSAQMPAVAILLFVLLAIGVAQCQSSRIDLGEEVTPEKFSPLYYNIAKYLSKLFGIILFAAGIWQITIAFSGYNDADKLKETAYNQILDAKNAGVLTTQGEEQLLNARNNLYESLKLVPNDSYSWAYLADVALLSGEDLAKSAKFLAASAKGNCCDNDLLFFRLKMLPLLWNDLDDADKEIFKNQISIATEIDSDKASAILEGFNPN